MKRRFAGDADLEKAAGTNEAVKLVEKVRRHDAEGQFFAGEIAQLQQEVVDAVGGARAVVFGEALCGLFHLGDGVGIEEFAQIGFAENLAQLLLVDGEGLGAPLGQRSIAVVEEICDVAEQERRGKGRGFAGVDDVHAELTLLNGAQGFDERGHVKDVAQALAIGLEQKRK